MRIFIVSRTKKPLLKIASTFGKRWAFRIKTDSSYC
jgi:hypothetical protein